MLASVYVVQDLYTYQEDDSLSSKKTTILFSHIQDGMANAPSTQPEDMDVVFCGGGTAACVAAGRLAAANPDLKIMLIEGGGDNYENPTIRNPALYLSHLTPDSKTALVSPIESDSEGPYELTPTRKVLQVKPLGAPWPRSRRALWRRLGRRQ